VPSMRCHSKRSRKVATGTQPQAPYRTSRSTAAHVSVLDPGPVNAGRTPRICVQVFGARAEIEVVPAVASVAKYICPGAQPAGFCAVVPCATPLICVTRVGTQVSFGQPRLRF